MRNRDFPPTGSLNTRRHLKIKEKDVHLIIKACLEKKKSVKVLGCILSDR